MTRVAPDPRAGDRCEHVWDVLSRSLMRDAAGRAMLLDRVGGHPATLWPYSQSLHAAVLLSHLRRSDEPVRCFGAGLEAYRLGVAYQPRRRAVPARRFVDDNAWVGLAASHAALLSRTGGPGAATARRLLRWVARHEAPGGGVRWREWSRGLHACSTGAAGVLAIRGPDPGTGGLAFARRCADFVLGPLRLPNGLVADSLRGDQLDRTTWSYNQGLAIGMLTLLHRYGDAGALGCARELADACVGYFAVDDRLWREPPCFVAVLGRMLLLLHAYDGDGRWVQVVDDYLDRVWTQTSGSAFRGSGIGAYNREHSLDLAGLTILTALRASAPDELELVC